MSIYFTGDLHFGHYGIIKHDKRPFETVEEMNSELIKRWNNKVGTHDTTYVLGDMFGHCNPSFVQDTLNALKGEIVLLKGNHDQWIKNANNRKFLKYIKDYDEIFVPLKNGKTVRCVLSHWFMPFYNGHFRGNIHLHAHSHVSDEAIQEERIARIMNYEGFKNEIYNVGCMYWNYEPVTLDEILKEGEKRNG